MAQRMMQPPTAQQPQPQTESQEQQQAQPQQQPQSAPAVAPAFGGASANPGGMGMGMGMGMNPFQQMMMQQMFNPSGGAQPPTGQNATGQQFNFEEAGQRLRYAAQ